MTITILCRKVSLAGHTIIHAVIYQCEALQMLEMIKQKALQLACVQVRYGITKIPHIFPMEYNICTDKLPSAATVHFL